MHRQLCPGEGPHRPLQYSDEGRTAPWACGQRKRVGESWPTPGPGPRQVPGPQGYLAPRTSSRACHRGAVPWHLLLKAPGTQQAVGRESRGRTFRGLASQRMCHHRVTPHPSRGCSPLLHLQPLETTIHLCLEDLPMLGVYGQEILRRMAIWLLFPGMSLRWTLLQLSTAPPRPFRSVSQSGLHLPLVASQPINP